MSGVVIEEWGGSLISQLRNPRTRRILAVLNESMKWGFNEEMVIVK